VRITAQLIEAETGAHLWADRFDGSLEDIFDFQDKVAINVAGVIEPALQAAEVRRSAARPTNDVTAFYLRALATYYPITKERLRKALELLQQAIAIDQDCGQALSLAAMCQMRLIREGWAEEPETASRKGIDLAVVLANFGEDIGAMMALIDRALTITPRFSRGWFLSGVLRLWVPRFNPSWTRNAKLFIPRRISGVADRQPHPNSRGDRDHRAENTLTAAAANSAGIEAGMRTRAFPANLISIAGTRCLPRPGRSEPGRSHCRLRSAGASDKSGRGQSPPVAQSP
jgi:hypothetical protein